MIRRQALLALLAMTAATGGHSQSPPAGIAGFAAESAEEPRLLRFKDAEAPQCNHLSLGTPAQINSQRAESGLTATILANFGCQTKAGDARVWRDGDTLVLAARTILPDYPTPQCLCTRKLTFVVADREAKRIRYHQDQRPAAEAEIGN